MHPSEYSVYTTGSWQPFPGQEEAFIAAWEEFAAWAAGLDGAGDAILARDVRAEGRYVSFFGWNDMRGGARLEGASRVQGADEPRAAVRRQVRSDRARGRRSRAG